MARLAREGGREEEEEEDRRSGKAAAMRLWGFSCSTGRRRCIGRSHTSP